jgi:hypothetical protein
VRPAAISSNIFFDQRLVAHWGSRRNRDHAEHGMITDLPATLVAIKTSLPANKLNRINVISKNTALNLLDACHACAILPLLVSV